MLINLYHYLNSKKLIFQLKALIVCCFAISNLQAMKKKLQTNLPAFYEGLSDEDESSASSLLNYSNGNTNEDNFSLLVDSNSNLNEFRYDDVTKDTLLHRAVKERNLNLTLQILEYLEERSLKEIDLKNADGDTALHLASRMGDCEIANSLIKNGAQLNELNYLGFTPLDIAKESAVIFKNDLRRQGAKTQYELQMDTVGQGELRISKSKRASESPDNVEFLEGEITDKYLHEFFQDIQSDARGINDNLTNGHTLLTWAAQIQNVELINQLLSYFKSTYLHPRTLVNIKNLFGKTALHIAVDLGNQEISQLLLESGANGAIWDMNGNSAISLAKSEEIKDLLKDYNLNKPNSLPIRFYVASIGAIILFLASYLFEKGA